ncbi:hypothetical protein FB639_005386 [Coemansia asiatica]|nr:hypothetical protein FB639_005386 [Coemansia asiatica]
MLSRLSSYSNSVDRLSQNSDAINHNLEALMRLFSPANTDNAAAADYLSASGGGGSDVGSASNGNVGGVANQNMGSSDLVAGGLTAADLSNEDSLMQLLSSEEFSNIAMSLINSASSAANPNNNSSNNSNSNSNNFIPALGADGGSNMVRSDLIDPFCYADNQQTAVPAAIAGAPDIFGIMPTGSPASNNHGNYNAQLLLDAIKSLTPEQQQNMLNYYRLTGQLNHMPLLTAGDTGNITHIDSPEAVNTTPFLEFVDPNAEPALGGFGSDEPNAESIGAQISADVTNADYDMLFKDALDTSSSSALIPPSSIAVSGIDIPGIDPNLAATLFQTTPILTSVAQSASSTFATDPKTGDQAGRK